MRKIISVEEYINLTPEEKQDFSPEVIALFEEEVYILNLVNATKKLADFLKLSKEDQDKLPEDLRERFTEEQAEKELFERRQLKAFDLKKKHNVKELGILIVDDAEAWIRKMDRKDISLAKSMGNGDEVSTAEILLDAIWLEGDERIRNDDEYFFGALHHINGMMDVKVGELVKF